MGVDLTPGDLKIRLWMCGLQYNQMNMILANKQDVKKMEDLVAAMSRRLETNFELTADQNVSAGPHPHFITGYCSLMSLCRLF